MDNTNGKVRLVSNSECINVGLQTTYGLSRARVLSWGSTGGDKMSSRCVREGRASGGPRLTKQKGPCTMHATSAQNEAWVTSTCFSFLNCEMGTAPTYVIDNALRGPAKGSCECYYRKEECCNESLSHLTGHQTWPLKATPDTLLKVFCLNLN